MIIDAIINLLVGLVSGLFDIVPFPDTPSFLENFNTIFQNIISTYVMPLLNFLYGHSFLVNVCNLLLGILAGYLGFKLIVWLYGKIRGSGSE